MGRDAESVIKKTISQRYPDQKAAMHIYESEKQETKQKRQTGRIKKRPLMLTHLLALILITLFKQLRTGSRPRKLENDKLN